ncbi:MAG: hypothetical protein Hyperionvirus2_193 [Hyperionvirus sp.]|uniref:Uncharacterized protein n=1 Tax=Hyperionvirus sp. TaxID=2487770 RepID=A0A3G5A6F6_9VIRU|nr:MAG: hypothetical protein Hyperionvirus2_193 [Hyperionvirus sp.]
MGLLIVKSADRLSPVSDDDARLDIRPSVDLTEENTYGNSDEFLNDIFIDRSFWEYKSDLKTEIKSINYDPLLVEQMFIEVKDEDVVNTPIYRKCIGEIAFNPHACYILGKVYRSKNNFFKAHGYYLKGMKMGYPKCFRSMAYLYIGARPISSQNASEYMIEGRKLSAMICLKRYLELQYDLQATIALARIVNSFPDFQESHSIVKIIANQLTRDPHFNRYLSEINEPDKLKQRVFESKPCSDMPEIYHIFSFVAHFYEKIDVHTAYLFKSLEYLSSARPHEELTDICELINSDPKLYTFEDYCFWFEFACQNRYIDSDYQMSLFCYNCKEYLKAKCYGDLAIHSSGEKMIDLFHKMYRDPNYWKVISGPNRLA